MVCSSRLGLYGSCYTSGFFLSKSPWVSLAPWLLNSSLQPGECELLQLERPDLRDLPSLKRTVERERKVEGYGVFPSGNWVNVTGS